MDKSQEKVIIKLPENIVKMMIDTYEFLVWDNRGTEDGKLCKTILKALKKSIKIKQNGKSL